MLVENFVLTFLDEIKYPFETTSKRFMHRALVIVLLILVVTIWRQGILCSAQLSAHSLSG